QMGIYCVQENDWSVMGEFLTQLTGEDALVAWISLVLNIPLTFIMFFGEEYGWRYYLQPRMQKKFGVALGTILLGVIWGLWHVAADFMYYSTETGPQMLIAQIIACIALGIFFGYAYMKTQNIWVPVVMHLMNNNMALVLSGDVSTNALQGNVIGWEEIPFYIIGYAVMWLFIFTPTMRGKSAEKNDVNTVGKTKEA
ncbi:MAG: CPBP family intramembrane metalloprotease, partial [Lachnospiraceae bacterium]|nr:CPBP family intramembrane metalloprotease [Lachnospiraceae bacterium]